MNKLDGITENKMLVRVVAEHYYFRKSESAVHEWESAFTDADMVKDWKILGTFDGHLDFQFIVFTVDLLIEAQRDPEYTFDVYTGKMIVEDFLNGLVPGAGVNVRWIGWVPNETEEME